MSRSDKPCGDNRNRPAPLACADRLQSFDRERFAVRPVNGNEPADRVELDEDKPAILDHPDNAVGQGGHERLDGAPGFGVG